MEGLVGLHSRSPGWPAPAGPHIVAWQESSHLRRWTVHPTRAETTSVSVTIAEHLAQFLPQNHCLVKYMLDSWVNQGRETGY